MSVTVSAPTPAAQEPATAPPKRLLAFLDPDPAKAAARFDAICLRLLKIFEWRQSPTPQALVDLTVERATKRLAEDAQLQVAEPYQFFYGVATTVLRESGPSPAPAERVLDAASPASSSDESAGVKPPDDPELMAEARRRLGPLAVTLKELLPKNQCLLLDYHRPHASTTWRDDLADALDSPADVISLRVHRLRAAVEAAVASRLRARAAQIAKVHAAEVAP